MARVSLIALVNESTPWAFDRINTYATRLEQVGHHVVVEHDSRSADPSERGAGLVQRTVDQLKTATGTYLIVVDLAMNYAPDDLVAVVDRLEQGSLSLVVAARCGRRFGGLIRRVVGTSDPQSGLVGLTREAAEVARGKFGPVGSRFVCELLARVEGKRDEVLVTQTVTSDRRWVPMDDIRHLKRIADERLGNLSRLLQFCFVGASGMVVDLTAYAALQVILTHSPLADLQVFRVGTNGTPISLAVTVAAVLAIAVAMTWNFSLNRRLTFNDARRGSVVQQYVRYVLSNLVGTGVSLTCRLVLPSSFGFFARHRLAAAVAGIVAATGISFSLARWFVFAHRGSTQHADNQVTTNLNRSKRDLVNLTPFVSDSMRPHKSEESLQIAAKAV